MSGNAPVLATPAEEDGLLDTRPVVELPGTGLPGAVIALVAAILALLLFVSLNARRHQAQALGDRTERSQADAFPPPPALVIPSEPMPATVIEPPAPVLSPQAMQLRPTVRTDPVAPAAAPTPIIVPTAPAPLVEADAPRRSEHIDVSGATPALVIDGGVQVAPLTGQGSSAAPSATRTAESPQQAGGSAPSRSEAAVHATTIGNRTSVMPIGSLIPAVLETPIDTTRPGLVRAVVSQDAAGFDGRRVLVPRGSRLIGEYQSEVRSGQSRVLVTWTELIRPDGLTMRLDAPAADALGGAGIPGRLHSYFLERFSSALLQSVLTVGVNLASRPGRGSVIVGLPGAAVTSVTGQGVLPSTDLRPKVTVKQGAVFNVFVAHNLDFSAS